MTRPDNAASPLQAAERDEGPFHTWSGVSLDLTVEGFTADMVQEAILVKEIPNAILAAEGALSGLLSSEMRKQLNQALDAHVVAAIAAASPDHGGSGSTVEELVRSGISEM